MRTVGLCLALLLLMTGVAAADPYFNSAEPGCNGSDPNVLMCDDFESGTWYVNDGDHRAPIDKGWGGTIYANPITPPGAVLCGAGAIFGTCSANGGQHGGGTGGRNMAGHLFKVGACGTDGGQTCGVDEVYARVYLKWEAGYQWSGEKNLNLTKSAGGIFWGNVHCNPGQGSRSSTCGLQISNYPVDAATSSVNAPLNLQSGRVYFLEVHYLLNTPGQSNGRLRLWTNDCGTDGKACGPAPVLRQDITNVKFSNRKTTADKIELLWLENWANNGDGVGSLGTGPYWDNVKVSRVGPIGFMGASTVPPPTTSYTLTTATMGAGAVSGAGSYPSGTVVTPVALPASGSTFSGWSGDCTGSGACTVTMTGNKNVTATFTTPTTPPPTGSVPPAPSSPTVTLGTTDPSGASFNVSWPAVTGATSYSYTAGLSDNSANLQGAVTPPNLLLKTPYMQNGAAGSGFVCIKSVNAAGSSEEAACNSLQIPAKPAVVPPQLTTGTLAVEAQVSRCNYFLTAEPPDAAGGWTAQFYRDGSTKVGNPLTAAPYKRSVELYAPSHSFSVQFTKTGQVMRSPAVVTRACP